MIVFIELLAQETRYVKVHERFGGRVFWNKLGGELEKPLGLRRPPLRYKDVPLAQKLFVRVG